MRTYDGTDNYGNPKSDYLKKIERMTDEEFESECSSMIYQAALCSNNPRADWHWRVDACYDESLKRDGGIYTRAWLKMCE